jgi:hypothetical protein
VSPFDKELSCFDKDAELPSAKKDPKSSLMKMQFSVNGGAFHRTPESVGRSCSRGASDSGGAELLNSAS